MTRVIRVWIWPPLINKIITPTLSFKYLHASRVWRDTSPAPRWIQEPLMKVCALAASFRTSPVASFLKKTDQNSVQLLFLLFMYASKLCRNHTDTNCWEYSPALMVVLGSLRIHLLCMSDRPRDILGRSKALWTPENGSIIINFRIYWKYSWYTEGLVHTFSGSDTPKTRRVCCIWAGHEAWDPFSVCCRVNLSMCKRHIWELWTRRSSTQISKALKFYFW